MAAIGWQLSVMFSNGPWEDFWDVSPWASKALWEVFLSASQWLFRQLFSRRTVPLSPSAPDPPTSYPSSLYRALPLSFCSLTCFLKALWRMWMGVSHAQSHDSSLYTEVLMLYGRQRAPHCSSVFCSYIQCVLFNPSKLCGGRSWKWPELLLNNFYTI